MSTSQLLVKNLSNSPLSIEIFIDPTRQLQHTLRVGESIDVAGFCSADDLNRIDQIKRLISKGLISVTPVLGSDINSAAVNALKTRSSAPNLFSVSPQALSILGPSRLTCKGSNLLQRQTTAQVSSGVGTSNVLVTANRPGVSGNLITIAFVDAASPSVVVSPTPTGAELTAATTITVNFRGATHSNTDNTTAVAALLSLDLVAGLLVQAVPSGTGNFIAATGKALTGGTGTGFQAFINGREQAIFSAVTDSVCYVSPTNVSAIDLGVVQVSLRSNGFDTVTLPINFSI